MIKINSNAMVISGDLDTLLSETTSLLHKLYFEMKNTLGEEQANEYLVEVGRLAVIPDEDIQDEMITF